MSTARTTRPMLAMIIALIIESHFVAEVARALVDSGHVGYLRASDPGCESRSDGQADAAPIRIPDASEDEKAAGGDGGK